MYLSLNVSGHKEPSPGVQDPERELTCVMLNTVVALLQGSVRNAGNDSISLTLSVFNQTRILSYLSVFKGNTQGVVSTNVVAKVHVLVDP